MFLQQIFSPRKSHANTCKRDKFWSGNVPKYLPYIFIAPNMILFFSFVILPLLFAFFISLNKWDIFGTQDFVGITNYKKLIFQDKMFWKSLWNTLYYTIGTVPVNMIISLLLALLLNRQIMFRAFFRGSLFLPSVISTVVAGTLWQWIFNDNYGIANYVLNMLGISSVGWLTNPKIAMVPIIIATLWLRIGYNLVIYLAGLQNIPRMYYEASIVDGANWWQQLCHITIPMLKPINIFVLILSVIYTCKSFDLIYVMTLGGPSGSTTTIVLYIYELAFKIGNMGKAAALGIVLFIIMAVVTFAEFKLGEENNG